MWIHSSSFNRTHWDLSLPCPLAKHKTPYCPISPLPPSIHLSPFLHYFLTLLSWTLISIYLPQEKLQNTVPCVMSFLFLTHYWVALLWALYRRTLWFSNMTHNREWKSGHLFIRYPEKPISSKKNRFLLVIYFISDVKKSWIRAGRYSFWAGLSISTYFNVASHPIWFICASVEPQVRPSDI